MYGFEAKLCFSEEVPTIVTLIGIRASKNLALKIKQEVIFFLSSSLQLKVNKEKTKLIHSFYDRVDFLGVCIHNSFTEFLSYRPIKEEQQKVKELNRSRSILLINQQKREKEIRKLVRLHLIRKYRGKENNAQLSVYKSELAVVLGKMLPLEDITKGNRGMLRSLSKKLCLIITKTR